MKVTAVAPVKPDPLIVTLLPIGPLLGLKLVTLGAGGAVTVKVVPLVAIPPGVTTVIGPVVAAAGTWLTIICVDPST